MPVILFAFNYLRNSAVPPRESFPICPKKWLKIIPNKMYNFPNQ